MVVAFIWNSRGMNRPDKLLRVHDLLREQCPDLISLSETKKTDFDYYQIRTLDPVGKYTWNWLPATGTAGGILVGVSLDLCEVLSWNINQYSVIVLIKNKSDSNIWRYISVYGTAYDEYKLDFINELHNVMASWVGPTAIGGGGTLISLERRVRKVVAILTSIGQIYSMTGSIDLGCWKLKMLVEDLPGLIIRKI